MRVRKVFAISLIGAVCLVGAASALAGDAKATKHSAKVIISAKSVAGLGKILVNGSGKTIYMFVPDKRSKVTCVSTCAKIWPPVKIATGAKAVAAGGVKQSLLSSDKSPAGYRIVTYNGWPLYLYLGDRGGGTASGQALNLNGGLWYVLSTSGAVIKAKPHSGGGGGGGTTTTSGGGGGGGGTTCSDDDGDGDASAGGPDDGDGCV